MAQHRWRLIHSGEQNGAINMAIDEALLEAVAAGTSPPVLRLYRWQPATLTLGYGQSIVDDIDLTACRDEGVDVVRRSTGGRAVLHDREVTYAVIARNDAGLFDHSVLECYRVIAKVQQAMLAGLGIEAELVPGESRGGRNNPSHAVCFTAPSQYELVVDGRKVVGSAQKRMGPAFLQHGSIPVEMDLVRLARVLKVSPSDRSVLDKVGWLNLWSSTPLTIDQVESQLIKAFEDNLHIEWEEGGLTLPENERARVLHDEKFAATDWTHKR